jgi:hypothetical protein
MNVKMIVPALVLLMSPAALPAQDCTYDTCALRIEGTRVVAGREGAAVATLRAFRTPRLEDRFAVSDSAAAHYVRFADNYVAGNVWSMVGGGALGLAYAASNDDASTTLIAGSIAVGIVASLVGGNKVRKAQAALSRAVWWYNRDLPR